MPHSSKKNTQTNSIPHPFLQNPTPSYDPPTLQQFFDPPFLGFLVRSISPLKRGGALKLCSPQSPSCVLHTYSMWKELFQSLPFCSKYALWPWSGNMNMDSSPYRMLSFLIYHRKSRTKKHLLFYGSF